MSTTNKEYIEFPEPSKASSSPSLPWFVEYWASSIASKPIHELLLCGADTTACTSESTSLQHTMDSTMNDLSTYSSRLRQVVAPHETDESDLNMQRYPTKGSSSSYAFPSIRKSSILYEEDEDDEDDTLALYKQRESILDKSMFEVDDDEEDTRDGAPATTASTATSSFMEDASSRMLYTCESFDNFLRGKSAEESAVRLAPRMVQDEDALVATTRPANSAVRQRLQPPPSPSATTYTTVSLTTSYMRDMDDSCMSDDEAGEDPKAVLERWTQASHQLFRGMQDETERQDIYSTPKQSRKRPSSSPPPCYKRKTVSPHQDKHEAYQYLIRMKPQNYIHDYSNNGWEEEKKEDNDAMFDLPSHLQLQSDMTFHEAFFQPPPSMPEF